MCVCVFVCVCVYRHVCIRASAASGVTAGNFFDSSPPPMMLTAQCITGVVLCTGCLVLSVWSVCVGVQYVRKWPRGDVRVCVRVCVCVHVCACVVGIDFVSVFAGDQVVRTSCVE